jgi:DNA helicase-2/ATP-dependent DNA helicase PcrA
LRKLNIPYRIYGGISFYQRKEIKDLLAYFKLTVNPGDEEAFKRIINYPARGIGKTTIEKLTVFAADNEKSLWEIAENIALFPFNSGARKLITDFVMMIRSFQAQMESKDAYELASHIAKSTGILKELYNDQTVEGLSRYENIQELLNSIKEFVAPEAAHSQYYTETIPPDAGQQKSLAEYLQQVTLLTDADQEGNEDDTVKLMTIHSAKGLEFQSVFVVGLEENLFPSALSLSSRDELEEERRLFYVAITRAEKKLTITHAATRYKYGNLEYCEPSRFLEELPQSLLNYIGYHSNKSDLHFQKFESATPVSKVNVASETAQYVHKPSANFSAVFPEELQVGMEVEHQKFGFGNIISMEGSNDAKMATIQFHKAGQKKILLKFAKLSIVGNP